MHHVEGLTQAAAATLDMALAPPLAAVPIKGSHSHQGGDLFAIGADPNSGKKAMGAEAERSAIPSTGNVLARSSQRGC